MSNLDHTAENIKKKLMLSDYQTDIPQHVNTPIPQEVPQYSNTSKKVKVTVYLTPEHWKMFNELCLKEMNLSGKPEKSQIICQAIECLYNR